MSKIVTAFAEYQFDPIKDSDLYEQYSPAALLLASITCSNSSNSLNKFPYQKGKKYKITVEELPDELDEMAAFREAEAALLRKWAEEDHKRKFTGTP